jgi:hypothetical protein
MAEKVLKTSGEPFPNAKNVTPVYQVGGGMLSDVRSRSGEKDAFA